MNGREFQALALLVGTIIGVGVFALPFVFFQAGFLLGTLELVVLCAAIVYIHLMYGDIALSVDKPHQLPGYARIYLGSLAGKFASLVAVFGLLGALVAYIILGGVFTENLIQYLFGSSIGGVGFVVFLVLGFFVFLYDRFFAESFETFLTVLLLFTLILLIFSAFQNGDSRYLMDVNLDAVAYPYGVILFALAGASVIPRVRTVLPGTGRGLKRVIVWGTLIPAVLYILFAAAIISGTAPTISKEAIGGLSIKLGPEIVALGSIVGILATVTSYIGLGLAFKSVLVNDFKFSPETSWLSTALIPPALILIGVSDYIRTIGLVGTFMVGIEGIFIVTIWKRLHAHRLVRGRHRLLSYAVATIFLLGVAYEVFPVIR